MAKRRSKGDGSVYQRHDAPSCPPADDDGERPDHRCQGRYVGVVDLGWSGGKRQRRTYYGRTEKEVRIKVKAAIAQRDGGALLATSPSVAEWMIYWLDVVCPERKLKVNTMKSYRSKVDQYVIPNIGRHRLDRLAPEHIRSMYAKMRRDGLAEGTLRQTHAILRRALTVAVRERKVSWNVALMMDPPGTEVTTPRQPLTLEEADLVLGTEDLRWWVALLLGLRQGEALGLKWRDVDLDAGVLTIERTLVREPGKGLVFGTPKSKASRRLVALPPKTLARFKVAAAGGVDPDALVFNRDGKPIDHRADWQRWQDTLAALGIQPRPLHAARHTTATLLEAQGVQDRLVAQMLGQSSVAVTHRYQHGDLEGMREAFGLLERPELTSGGG